MFAFFHLANSVNSDSSSSHRGLLPHKNAKQWATILRANRLTSIAKDANDKQVKTCLLTRYNRTLCNKMRSKP